METKQPLFATPSIPVDCYVCFVFLVWTLAAFPLLAVYALARMLAGDSPGRAFRRTIWRYARTMLRLLSPVAPVSLENADVLLRYAPCILVANHQSFLDLYLFAAQKQSDLVMLAKRWPFRLLFFFAPVMRSAGYINVEDTPAEAVERQVLQLLESGSVVIAFPEGSRSRDGHIGRFHSGAFYLATRASVPVIPLKITGVERVFPVGARHFTPGCIRLRFMQPVFPSDFVHAPVPHRAMMRHVRELYEENATTPREVL